MMQEKNYWVLGVVSFILCLFIPLEAAEMSLTKFEYQGQKCLLVESDFYYAVINPSEGGSISSLTLKPCGTQLTTRTGFCNDMGHTGSPQFGKAPFSYQVIKETSFEVSIALTSLPIEDIQICKTYSFFSNSPIIGVKVSVANFGNKRDFGYRTHNFVKASKKGIKGGDSYFVPVSTGCRQLTVNKMKDGNYFTDVVPGWGGCINKSSKKGIAVRIPKTESLKQVLIWKCSDSATFELYFPSYLFARGEKKNFTFEIFPFHGIGEPNLVSQSAKSAVNRKQGSLRVLFCHGLVSAEPRTYPGLYGIEKALRELPGGVSIVSLDYIYNYTQYNVGYVKGFPMETADMANYNVVVLADIPGYALNPAQQKALREYIKKGGIVLFLGEQAVGFAGTELEKMLPIEVDRSEKVRSAAKHRDQYDNILSDLPISFSSHPALHFVPQNKTTNCNVYKSKAKKGSQVLASCESTPLLVVSQFGEGKIISFPISLIPKVNPASCDEIRGLSWKQWNGKLPVWDYYDELLRGLVMWAINSEPEPKVVYLVTPKDVSYKPPATLEVSVCLRNDSTVDQKGKLILTVADNFQRVVKQDEKTFVLRQEEEKEFKLQVEHLLSGRYKFRIEMSREESQSLLIANAEFMVRPSTYLNVQVEKPGVQTVFGRNGNIQFQASLGGEPPDERDYFVKAEISSKKSGQMLRSKQVKFESASVVKDTIAIGNLAYGEYRLVFHLLDSAGKVLDQFHKPIYIVPAVDKEDFFPLASYGLGLYGFRDEDFRKSLSQARDVGINACCTWLTGDFPVGSARLRQIDFMMRHGFALIPKWSLGRFFHYDFAQYSKSPVGKPDFEGVNKSKETLLDGIFRSNPRILNFYVVDEPNLERQRVTQKHRQLFEERFGTPVPTNHSSRYWWQWWRFRCNLASEGGRQMHRWASNNGIRLSGTFNALMNGDMEPVGMAEAIDDLAVDIYTHGWRENMYLDMLRSAAGFRRIWFIAVAGEYGATPCYPESAGQSVYSALAHNCEGIYWYEWNWPGHGGLADPQGGKRGIECLAQANNEMKVIGPAFKHLNKVRSRIALLTPWTSRVLQNINPYADADLVSLYSLLRNTYGQIDILHEAQLEKEKYLKDYKVLVIHNCPYLPKKVMQEISSWVKSGGILMCPIGNALKNEFQEADTTLSSLFGVSAGTEIVSQVSGVSEILPLAGVELKATTAIPINYYQSGEVASTRNSYGKGQIYVWGFEPNMKKALTGFVQASDVLVCSGEKRDIDEGLFTDSFGSSFYLAAVNFEHRERVDRIRMQLPQKRFYAFDMLSGEEIPILQKDNFTEVSLEFRPNWGRTVAFLPTKPEHLRVSVHPENVPQGEMVSLRIDMLSGDNKLVQATLPVEIIVYDPSNKIAEGYSAKRSVKGGTMMVKLRVADNDPVGMWQIKVSSPMVARSVTAGLKVIGG